jgi:hypothetical protein
LQLLFLEISHFLDQIPQSALSNLIRKPSSFPNYLSSVLQNTLQAIRSVRIQAFKHLKETFVTSLKQTIKSELNNSQQLNFDPNSSPTPNSFAKLALAEIWSQFSSLPPNSPLKLHQKDLWVTYLVISLKTISHLLNNEKGKFGKSKNQFNTNSAMQLAVDLEYLLQGVVKGDVLEDDSVYRERVKQLAEVKVRYECKIWNLN